MASYLCALIADSGLPLFARSNGDLKQLPFATVGVLNGVHMFSHLQGSELQRAVTSEEKVLWRVYHNSIVLILITRNDACDDCHLINLLDNIFASMAMLTGLDSLIRPGNVEKLKRELKICYNLIDYLLNQMDEEYMTVGDLTQRVDVVLSYESHSFESFIGKYLEVAESEYSCLFVHGKVACATKQWWSLASQELVLLAAIVNAPPKSTSREVAVYLPVSCPRERNRLLILQLLKGIELCVLCGSTPALSLLEDEAPKIWKGSFDLFKAVTSLHPRNFPSNIAVDPNIVGILLVNKELKQTFCSVCPNEKDNLLPKEEWSLNLLFRQEALRTLYKQVVGTHFPEEFSLDFRIRSDVYLPVTDAEKTSQNKCQVKDFYMCTEQYKCYAISSPPYEIFLIYNNQIPHYALRPVSHKTLKALTVKKLIPRCFTA